MMNIQEIILNNQLDNNEQQIFYEYCRNRFADTAGLNKETIVNGVKI